MDLESLQKWVEILYHKVRVQKEFAEYQAYLLDEITQPWPLNAAPKSVQESYKAELENQRTKEEELSKLSEFDKELQSVENILQKARLLHEKEKKVPKSTKVPDLPNGTNDIHPKIPQKVVKSAKIDTKKVPKLSLKNPIPRDTKTNSTTTRRPLGSNLTRTRSADSRKGSAIANSMGYTTGPLKSMSIPSRRGQKSNPPSTVKSRNSSQNSPKDIRSTSESVKTTPQASIATHPPISSVPIQKKVESVSNGITKDIKIDLSKVKLSFNDVNAELELPPKMKKLLSTHVKLKDQIGGVFADKECPEEANFVKNLCHGQHPVRPPQQPRTRTLNSLNSDLCQCIRTCTDSINLIKANKVGSRGGGRQNFEQTACLASQTLNIVEDLYYQLREKFQDLSQVEIVDVGISGIQGGDFLSQLPLDDLTGMLDDLPYPALTLTYQSTKEVMDWTCERLRHQYLIIERNLLCEISQCYFRLIDKMMESENDDVPSTELVHVLQNAYGLLANDNFLLPAYVVAE